MKQFHWKWIDTILCIVVVVLFAGLLYKGIESNKYNQSLEPVLVEIVVPNMEPEVADQIQVGDLLVDKNANPVFEIIEKKERLSQHPVITQEGDIVATDHPLLVSLFLWVESVEPMDYKNGIHYNWQVVKVGGSLIWESTTERFVGFVRQLNTEPNK